MRLAALTPALSCCLLLPCRPTAGGPGQQLHLARPARLRAAAPPAMQNFEEMKRADDPLEEELRALQIIGGLLGSILGPRIVGSSVIGITLGVLGGRALAYQPGAAGLQARELGWQLSQAVVGQRERGEQALGLLRRESETRGLPELWNSTRAAAASLVAGVVSEARAAEESLGLRVKATAFVTRCWEQLCAWAASSGVSDKLTALRARVEGSAAYARASTKLGAWYAEFNANVERRRRRSEGGA